jgi:hypothetical protein
LLIGKRVVCCSEASVGFMNSSAFKALTGDGRHTINPKGKQIYTAALDPLFFLFSNDPPEVDGKDEIIERIIDCYLEKPKCDLLPEHEYQALLKAELPRFLGYCRELYKGYEGKRIPCEKEGLNKAIENGESEYIDMFHSHWILEKNAETSANMVRRQLEIDRVNSQSQKKAHRIWEKEFGITKEKRHGCYYFIGMRKRTSCEDGREMLDF